MDADTKRVARELGQRLARIEQRLDHLDSVGRSPQLTRSSIDDGTLETRDADGNITSSWGKQPDGEHGTAWFGGNPPNVPTGLTATPIVAGVDIFWNGTFDGIRTSNFSHLLLYASDEGAGFSVVGLEPWGTLTRTGTFPITPLEADTEYWVKAVAVSTSGLESDPSDAVSATPAAVVATEILDGIVDELALADGAVTSSKVAVGAIGEVQLDPVINANLSQAIADAADGIAAAAAAQTAADAAQATADGAIRTYYQADPPGGLNDTTDLGDLWFDTDSNQAYRWNGTTWVLIQDNTIAEALAAAADAQATADGKIVSYWQGTEPVGAAEGDLWYDTAHDNRAHWWDGADWQPVYVGTGAIEAESITSELVAANAIQALHIVAGAIDAGKIAVDAVAAGNIVSGAVTTEKLAALAVTAAKIAANAIEAGHITAGAITAEKLAAEIVLASKIIVGALGGSRLELDPVDGFVQYNADNERTVSLGVNAEAGNYLSIYGKSPMVRRNLSTNPKLTNDSTGWSVTGATGSRVSGSRLGTAQCYRATFSVAGAATVSTPTASVTGAVSVTAQISVNPSVTLTMTPSLQLRNGAGTVIGTVTGSGVSCPANTVTVLSVTTDISAGVASVTPRVAATLASGQFYESSLVMVETTNTVNPYFDGDTVLGDNALMNPGFEDGAGGWQWSSGESTAGTARSGSAAAVIDAGATLSEASYHQLVEGGTISASAWIRNGTGAAVSLTLTLDYSDDNGAAIGSDTIPGTTAASYAQVSDTFTVPEGATQVKYSIVNSGAANAYVDDCSLVLGTQAAWDGTAGSSTSTLTTQSAASTSLATLDNGGRFSAQGITVTDAASVTFGGRTLPQWVDGGAGRIMAWAQRLGADQSSSAGSTERSFQELSFFAEEGRMYELATNPILAGGDSGQAPDLGVAIRYTIDGTAPTVSSPLLQLNWIGYGLSGDLSVLSTFGQAYVRLLYTIRSNGNTSFARCVSNSQAGVHMWVKDVGPDPVSTAQTTQWTNTWTRCFMHMTAGGQPGDFRSDQDMVQGWSQTPGVQHCATQIGFDYTNIQATLSGKTIIRVDLYLYADYWYRNTGGVACIGSHSNTAPPAGFNNITGFNITQQRMSRPQGLWVNLPVSVGNQFRDGTIRGLTLDAIFAGKSTLYAGRLNGHGLPGQPILRITYS